MAVRSAPPPAKRAPRTAGALPSPTRLRSRAFGNHLLQRSEPDIPEKNVEPALESAEAEIVRHVSGPRETDARRVGIELPRMDPESDGCALAISSRHLSNNGGRTGEAQPPAAAVRDVLAAPARHERGRLDQHAVIRLDGMWVLRVARMADDTHRRAARVERDALPREHAKRPRGALVDGPLGRAIAGDRSAAGADERGDARTEVRRETVD